MEQSSQKGAFGSSLNVIF